MRCLHWVPVVSEVPTVSKVSEVPTVPTIIANVSKCDQVRPFHISFDEIGLDKVGMHHSQCAHIPQKGLLCPLPI